MTTSPYLAQWQQAITDLPLIAILRGLTPEEAVGVAQILLDAGFTVFEVPLNSPQPFESIQAIAERFGEQAIIGAGTVITAEEAVQTLEAGGKLIVAPCLSEEVAYVATEQGAIYCPGVATPTEAFQALSLGATGLKLFPAEMISPSVVKAMKAVLPSSVDLFPVGGISPETMGPYMQVGVTGFGIGSALYSPGKSGDALAQSAKAFVQAYRSLKAG